MDAAMPNTTPASILVFISVHLFSVCGAGYSGTSPACVACAPDNYNDAIGNGGTCLPCGNGATTDGLSGQSACGEWKSQVFSVPNN